MALGLRPESWRRASWRWLPDLFIDRSLGEQAGAGSPASRGLAVWRRSPRSMANPRTKTFWTWSGWNRRTKRLGRPDEGRPYPLPTHRARGLDHPQRQGLLPGRRQPARRRHGGPVPQRARQDGRGVCRAPPCLYVVSASGMRRFPSTPDHPGCRELDAQFTLGATANSQLTVVFALGRIVNFGSEPHIRCSRRLEGRQKWMRHWIAVVRWPYPSTTTSWPGAGCPCVEGFPSCRARRPAVDVDHARYRAGGARRAASDHIVATPTMIIFALVTFLGRVSGAGILGRSIERSAPSGERHGYSPSHGVLAAGAPLVMNCPTTVCPSDV